MIVASRRCVLIIICLGCSAQAPPIGQARPTAPRLNRLFGSGIRSNLSATGANRAPGACALSLPPDVKVMLGPLRSSEFPNYDALTVTFSANGKKQEFEFLLSQDHKTLVRLTKLDLSNDPYAEVMKKIDVTGRPTRGNKDAKVTVVNYDDFECPFCSRMHCDAFSGAFQGI